MVAGWSRVGDAESEQGTVSVKGPMFYDVHVIFKYEGAK